ncbi:MAG TPA: nuclear transport factor 2 family protein [Polyangiales bacterium]|nr:nuclear transport factor 2 family protein [Polyangiales bacterium]
MSKPKPSPIEAAIRSANASFYRTFSVGDYEAMARLWAERAPVSCVHPGMPALHGRETVMESWRQILSGGSPFEMRADHPEVSLFGETAIVTCYEGNDQQPAHLAATNVFVLEGGQWRMVHHHAGPLARTIARDSASSLN